jgi:hypothetical protein
MYLSPPSHAMLLRQIEEASTAAKLSRSVNRLQKALWNLPQEEQDTLRRMAADILIAHVLSNGQEQLRLEAAGWLRLFVQAGMVANPIPIFVTLVTALVRAAKHEISGSSKEQHTYLKMIFDCFWPFRSPRPAYSREEFPANDVFYPLVALLKQADHDMLDALFGIFAELPNLDDPEIRDHLLPLALHWANASNAEYRRRSVYVLSRMSNSEAREALQQLQQDSDLQVRTSAKYVANFADN